MVATMAFVSISPAVAQGTATPTADFADPSGIYGRIYAANPDALFPEATPGADAVATPPIIAVVQAYEFGSDEDAEASFESVSETVNEQITQGTSTEFQQTDVDDLGDQGIQSTGTVDASGFEVPLTTLVVREGNIIFLAAAGTLDDSSADAANAFMEHMLNEESGDSAVEFNEDGTSTGGIFDVFPTVDDDVIQGMTVNGDTFTQPHSATPES